MKTKRKKDGNDNGPYIGKSEAGLSVFMQTAETSSENDYSMNEKNKGNSFKTRS